MLFSTRAGWNIWAGVMLLLSFPLIGTAQEPQQDSQENLPTFTANVNVVNLFFNVKDKKGALIPNLTKDSFEVYEDGKPQNIKYFSAETNQPLTLGLLIDTSVSQERVLPMEKEVGAAFLRDVLRPKDLAFVISFDVNVDLLHDYTNEARVLRDALESAKINSGGGFVSLPGTGGSPVPTSGTPKGTLLYDAVYLAAREKLSTEVGRKAMILLTDGADQGSQMNMKAAVEAAQKADTIVYVLLIADRGFYGGAYYGEGEMKKMAQETGGRVIDVGNKIEKLREAFDQIAAELRSQYSIGYTPTNTVRDGSFRKIEIKTVGKDLKVQARKGYYAASARSGD
ncbi:MAG TPA: VWA domain-containing protein [Terriglobales bacterium]|nr:VWA domain-containing protein [Terriglobales bacterium]